LTSAIPLTSDVKSAISPFDAFTTGVGVRAEMPAGKIDGSFCKGFLDSWRFDAFPFFRSPGVPESSREETAGRSGSVLMRVMGIVSPGATAVVIFGTAGDGRMAPLVVACGERWGLFSDHDAGFVFERSP
jgi:hypothetical protein